MRAKTLLLTPMMPPLWLSFQPVLSSQADKQSDKASPNSGKVEGTSRLRIELTGGDQDRPVAEASVYLKFVEERKLWKDKKIELNLKTNQSGVTQSPEIPKGKVLIQIVAPGWKTYGEYHELTADEQTIRIHLVRPTTKWYR